MQIKNGVEYHSLYEYLGYAAGPSLGDKVNKAAIKTKQEYVTQEVKNPVFEGEVFCYTREFLNEYFKTTNK
tara:strand:+ start:2143 stop:2355 length:213 start_codon:yes stop_codon:yes gene_type:complete